MNQVITRKTQTYSDTLEAVGVATLAQEMGSSRTAIVEKSEAAFEVEALVPRAPRAPQPGYPYVWIRSKEPDPPPGVSRILDYEAEKERRNSHRAWQAASRKAQRAAEDALDQQSLSAPPEPHPDFALAAILASMRKGWWADLDLARWIAEDPDRVRSWALARLQADAFADEPSVSSSQVLNPVAGKGVSGPKTEARSAGSLPQTLLDPFAEWMKLRGMWTAMLAYRVNDDFKFFVLTPRKIGVAALTGVRDELRQRNLWGGIRLDIEATLRCAEILIRHSEAYGVEASSDSGAVVPDFFVELTGRRPRDLISGLQLAYFKSLGTAAALMGDSLLPLPAWFVIESRDDCRAYVDLIEEAIGSDPGRGGRRTYGCLASLQEKNSDDGAIFQQFRRWLLTGDVRELLALHGLFAIHLMQRFGAGEFARPFSTTYLDTLLIRGYAMKDIVENPGFLSVARALRNATIYAARDWTPFEVRFGLAQKWKQEVKAGQADFVSELSRFVQDYNWENVHRRGSRYHAVSTEDLDQLFGLIESRGHELVGSLLLAYGFARRPKEADAQEEPEAPSSVTEGE